VHVVFHGCGQAAANWDVGDAVYGHAGYNRWADQNKIIVLYPQTTPSAVNFDGCWDWWGYTNYLDGAN
jgi:poly(3-hydroxybutyrate) depolymerase